MGSVCGYKVGMEKRVSNETRICYATTGYVLESIIGNSKALFDHTHIILDEVNKLSLSNKE
jgi:ATP-dependent RNA helicase TDRD9